MKKFFTFCLLCSVGLASKAQRLITEDFNYAVGQLSDASAGSNVGGGAWTYFSGNANYIMVTSGNLTYPNYFTNPTPSSNKITLVDFPTSSEDVLKGFTPQSSGTLYSSFLIKLLKTDNLSFNSTTGEYFIAFLPSGSIQLFRARVHIRQGTLPNTVNFGINTTSTSSANPPVWSPIDYPADATHLITFAYQFVAGAQNDIAKLWVDLPFSATEPAPSATAVFPSDPGVSTEEADLGRIALRQAAFNTPNADIDAITVATSYAASLPLNLTSFKAALNGKATTIKWTTENEVNVSGFSIEKSLDGVNFSQFGFVPAKNGATHTEYSLLDSKVKGGNTFYRLKQVDKDGSYKLSSIEIVKNNLAIATEVFPNPTRGNLTVHHGEAAKGATVNVMSLDGKLVKSMKVETGSTQTTLTVSELVKGNYVLVFDNGGAKSLTQFSKQ